MDIQDEQKNEAIENPQQIEEITLTSLKPKTNEELNAKDPSRLNRRQATEAQLSNPLHGVKLAQILERLVEHYGWTYLGDRVNIRCFKYNPTMKSSLGFLRRTRWAREHVEDVYLDMLDELKSQD